LYQARRATRQPQTYQGDQLNDTVENAETSHDGKHLGREAQASEAANQDKVNNGEDSRHHTKGSTRRPSRVESATRTIPITDVAFYTVEAAITGHVASFVGPGAEIIRRNTSYSLNRVSWEVHHTASKGTDHTQHKVDDTKDDKGCTHPPKRTAGTASAEETPLLNGGSDES